MICSGMRSSDISPFLPGMMQPKTQNTRRRKTGLPDTARQQNLVVCR